MILALRLFCIFTLCLVTDKIRGVVIESLVTALTPGIMGSRSEHGLTRKTRAGPVIYRLLLTFDRLENVPLSFESIVHDGTSSITIGEARSDSRSPHMASKLAQDQESTKSLFEAF